MVQHPAADAARQDAQGDGQHHREQEGHQGERRRHRQLVREHLPHALAVTVAGAEVAPDEISQPLPVTDEHRPVQPQLGTQGGHLLRRGVHAQNLGRGVAGNDGKSQEGEEGNNQQCNNESKEFF